MFIKTSISGKECSKIYVAEHVYKKIKLLHIMLKKYVAFKSDRYEILSNYSKMLLSHTNNIAKA